MATSLEYAIDHIGGTDFEKLVPEFLKEIGYKVKASGEHGTDGGWDAFIEIGSRTGVAHASTQKRWKQKIRKDAESSAELQDEYEKDFDVFVFVTNRQPTGQQELDIQRELRDQYDWEVKILHRRDLISTLGTDRPDLAERYLGVDPRGRQDNLKKIEGILADRLDEIRNQRGVAAELDDANQIIAVHLLPNGMTARDYAKNYKTIPEPKVFDRPYEAPVNSLGQGKYVKDGRYREDKTEHYTLLQANGLYEAVSTEFFYGQNGENPFITNRDAQGLDSRIGGAVENGMKLLVQMGVSGPVFLFITLIGVKGYKMSVPSTIRKDGESSRGFSSDEYTTKPVVIEDLNVDGRSVIKDAVDELWREAGLATGSPYFTEEGDWDGPVIHYQ